MSSSPYRTASSVLLSVACSVFAAGALAQLTTTVQSPSVESEVKLITQITDQVAFGAQVMSLSNPSSTQEELPGLGHKFELLGVMMRDSDPENMSANSGGSGGGKGGNEGISATTTQTTVALALRNTPPGVKIAAFNNQLGFKYFFVNRSCGGGSPRLTLLVDANGDGSFNQSSGDFAAHGHPNPFEGCPPNRWMYENLTDEGPRWEVTPGGAAGPTIPVFPFSTWDTLQAAVTTLFPNHKILAGFLVDDSCSFSPAACGKAHYDLVTVENRTLEIWQDTVKND